MRVRPHAVGGLIGMLLVAALYVAHAWLVSRGSGGLGAGWLAMPVVPGAVAAHLCRRGMQSASEKEGALAGVLTAHFASALQVAVLTVAVLTTNWDSYAAQVGPRVAASVRDASLPATLAVAVVVVALTYAWCVFAGWLGALVYLAGTMPRKASRE